MTTSHTPQPQPEPSAAYLFVTDAGTERLATLEEAADRLVDNIDDGSAYVAAERPLEQAEREQLQTLTLERLAP